MTFIAEHWFDLLQSVGIIASLLFALKSFREQTKQLKTGNSFLINQHHRELWANMMDHPELSRVFDPETNVDVQPITERERVFVNMLFLHMAACVRAVRAKAVSPIEGIEADLREILTFPLPRRVWENVRRFHDKDFVEFVEANYLISSAIGTVALDQGKQYHC